MQKDIKDITLSEIRERKTPYNLTYTWNLKIKQIRETKWKQIHRYKEQTGGCQTDGVGGWEK